MNSPNPLQTLSLVHELTLSILDLFDTEYSLKKAIQSVATRLQIPIILLWETGAEQPKILEISGLSHAATQSLIQKSNGPQDILSLPLKPLHDIVDFWCFPLQPQSPYLLQVLFRHPPQADLQNVLQKLCISLHKALTYRKLQSQNHRKVQRFKTALETSPDGVLFLSPTGTIQHANPMAEQLLERNIPLGTNLFEHLQDDPDPRSLLKYWLKQPWQSAGYWKIGKDKPRILDVRCVSVPTESFYTLYIRDVTQAQQTAQHLRETKARLETMVEHLQMGVVLQSHQEVLLSNHYLENLFDLPFPIERKTKADDLHQQIAQYFVQPKTYLKAIEALKQDKGQFLGKVYTCNNGKFVEHDAIPIVFDDVITGHLWVFRDVTDKILAKSTQQRLAQFPEKNPNPIMQIEHTGKVLYANIPARYLLNSWHTDLYKQIPESMREHLQKAKAKGQALLDAVPFGKRYFQMLVVYFKAQNIYHIYATDMTKRHRAEQEALNMRDQAIKASAAKSEFLAVMSHEIRTPLNAILGMLELLSQSALPTTQSDYIHSAREAGTNLLGLMNNILDFARLESGQLELHKEPFQLLTILEQCISVFQFRASAKHLQLSFELPDHMNRWFVGDPARLRQILFILIDNALKFTAEGSVKLVVSDHNEITFSVIDTGVGITKEKQLLIFDRFAQADSSITREYGGSGLGLSIAKELVELHHGKISVQSNPQKGSTFTFFLKLKPLSKSQARQQNQRNNQVSSQPNDYKKKWLKDWRHSPSILIVEDAPENRLLMGAYLADFPLTLHFANNGHEGIQAWKKHDPDIVLMDIQMPILDGLSATRTLHKLAKDKSESLLVVALTADTSKQTRQEALAAGCVDLMTKPVSQQDILQLLDRFFSHPTQEKKAISPREVKSEKDYNFLQPLQQIYPIFFKSRQEELKNIESMLLHDQWDWTWIKRTGHSLRGSGSSFGFPRISEWGEALEKAAEKEDKTQTQHIFAAIKNYLLIVEPEVNARMS